MELEGPEAWEIGGVRVVTQYPRPDDYEPGGAGGQFVFPVNNVTLFLSLV